MRRVGIDPIVVVTGKQGDELEKHISDLEVISLRNPDYETEQMFDSISMGLRYIRGLCTQTLILPADAPPPLKASSLWYRICAAACRPSAWNLYDEPR